MAPQRTPTDEMPSMAAWSPSCSIRDSVGGSSQMTRRNKYIPQVRNVSTLRTQGININTHALGEQPVMCPDSPIPALCVLLWRRPGPGYDARPTSKWRGEVDQLGEWSPIRGNSKCNGPRATWSLVIHTVGTNQILGTQDSKG